ncbi:MAG: hypothetical protein GXO31_01865, partial [Epsilonproteobacteria bacterium]|nr:hypothetical protein [Campylobacterota bacterium]
MKRSALWILFLGFALFGAQIDVDLLTKIAKKDPSDIKTRLLLAKYHIQKHNYDKADIYISQILKNDPKNKIAKELQKKLKRIKVLNELLKEYGVKNPDDKKEIEKLFQKLFQNREYKKVTIFYKLLSSQNISLNDKSKLISLRSFLKIGEIKEAQNLKESIKTPLYRYEAKGDIYFYKKDYPKAKQNYIKALKISYDKDTLANLL